jgi:aspartate/methionine/tyrosine aminotransferase
VPQVSPTASLVRAGVFAQLEDKIRARQAAGAPLVPLHIGDTFLTPHASAHVDTLTRGAAEPYRYGPTGGLDVLRTALATMLSSTANVIDPNTSVHIGFGATHALFSSARALLGHGDDVLLAAPYWPLTPGVFHACGAQVIDVDISTAILQGATLDLVAAFEQKRTPNTRAIYFASPNNPDGFVWSSSHLRALFNYAVEHDLWIFADEVYRDYVYEGVHTSMLQVDNSLERTLVFGSLSKSHALAGYRIGYAVANADVIARARRVSTHTGFNVPAVLQEAGARALTDGATWVANARATYASARTASRVALAEIPSVTGSGGTYHFLNLDKVLAGRSIHTFLDALLDRGVLLAPGGSSGERYATWARLCFTSVPEPTLLQGIAELVALARRF